MTLTAINIKMMQTSKNPWSPASYQPLRGERNTKSNRISNVSTEYQPGPTSPAPTITKGLYWRTPTTMVAAFLTGIIFAIAHHLYYSSMRGRLVYSSSQQEWALRIGNAFAFLVKTSFASTIGVAYIQHLFTVFKRRSLSVDALDSAFGGTTSIFNLASWELFVNLRGGFFLALIIWLLPLVSFITPATLSVVPQNYTRHYDIDAPTLNFSGYNLAATSLDPDRNGEVSPAIQRLFTTTYSSASVLLMPAVGSNPPNSTYDAEFLGPLITCASLNSSESAIMDNIVNHTSAWYQSLGSSGAGVVEYLLFKPDVAFMDATGQPNETFDYFNFIGSITNTSRNVPPGPMNSFWAYSDEGSWSCHTSNATFRGKFTTHLQKQDITVHNANITSSPLGDYSQNWSDPHSRIAYEMIVRMIFSLLEGAIVHDLRPDSDPRVNAIPTVFRTSIMQTGMIGALNFSTGLATGAAKTGRATTDKPIITPEDESLAQDLSLGALIEQLSRNVTMSFFSDTQFWSAPGHGFNTTVTAPYTRNVFWYNARNLLITYAIAFGLTLVSVVGGARAFHYNGVSHSKNFSAMIQMTRNPTLDDVTRGQGLGRQPLDETFKETKLRFGILAASSESGEVGNVKPVKIGFGTPDEIIPLDEKAFR